MANEKIKLSELVGVGARFGRSVNLERDFYAETPLNGYVLTTTGRITLDRLMQGLENTSGVRAWTLTGPYGSGKSAFALFAAKLLSSAASKDTQLARQLVKDQDKDFWLRFFDRRRKSALPERGLCPVLVTGTREPLGKALLRGLIRSIEEFWSRKPPLLLAEARGLLEAFETGKIVSGRQIVEVYEQAAEKVCLSSSPGGGLLVIVDELGKFLEYAAVHPQHSDIFLLQEMAEAAKQSTNHPLLLVTILHQTFDRYVEKLGRTQREEWMKVQGRFEDIAFQEPTEQLLRILSQAIRHKGPDHVVASLDDYGHRLAEQAEHLGVNPSGTNRDQIVDLVRSCIPLHPTVALALGHLFRRLGQNERSFFAFLTSHEPHGFQEFLGKNTWDKHHPLSYRLDQFYDYVITTLGSGLYAQGQGKKWAEIESALDRLVNPSEVEVRLIKVIGLLRVVGDIGNLKPSKEVLEFALEDEKVTAAEIEKGLKQLQHKSIIIYRRYNDGFSLWDGSDVDIDERLREARARVDPNESLARSLTRYFRPRPVVARHHSFRTGTLRYFDVRYTQLDEFEEVLRTPLGEADGLILYAVAMNDYESSAFVEKSQGSEAAAHGDVLIAVPSDAGGLKDAVFDVACLRWVRENTPELEGDRTARSELQARLASAEALVDQLIQSYFHPDSNGLAADEQGCKWFRRGTQVEIGSARALQAYLTIMCDEVYSSTPLLRNELVNRRHISSSAAAARRVLIESMLTRSDEESLGIKGYPPQLSIYLSLLKETGIHRKENRSWGFYAPPPSADSGILALWDQLDRFFAATELERRTVADLFDLLKKPPFGIKEGPLPIILCASLLYYDTEVALYEQDSFVPVLSLAAFERLIKAPETFKVQRCRVAGIRAVMFKRFAEILLQKPERVLRNKPNLLSIVRPLLQFSTNLPAYTKNTQRLTPTTLRVRDTLSRTREPDHLLFEELPAACGLAPFLPDDLRRTDEIEDFFKILRESLSELQRAYQDLLVDLEGMLISAFKLKGFGEDARRELRERAQPLLDLTVEPKLKSFLIRAVDDSLDLTGWRESTATFLSGKPPGLWNDTDRARFEVTLAEVSRSFIHIELLSFELRKHRQESPIDGGEMIRLGVTTLDAPEHQKVLNIQRHDRALVDETVFALEKALKTKLKSSNVELRLAVLAKLAYKFLQELEFMARDRASDPSAPDVARADKVKEKVS